MIALGPAVWPRRVLLPLPLAFSLAGTGAQTQSLAHAELMASH